MQLFETPDNPAPPGAACHEVKTRGGIRLRVMTAPPVTEPVKGTAVILNGRADYIERYFETARELQMRGFHVVAFDWRGQGCSDRLLKDRLRGYIRSFKQFDEDLHAVMETLVLATCPGPYYALAHSTGGQVLLRNVFGKTWFKRVVVTSPLLGFIYGAWPRPVAYLLASTATAFGLGWLYLPGYAHGPFLLRGFANNPLTRDEGRWDRDKRTLESEPQLGVGGPTFSWFLAALMSMRKLHREKRSHSPACPVLIVIAGLDRVVSVPAIKDFAAHVPGISVVTLPESQHEILIERDAIRSMFWAAFDSYIASA